jgi:hypothetical protein
MRYADRLYNRAANAVPRATRLDIKFIGSDADHEIDQLRELCHALAGALEKAKTFIKGHVADPDINETEASYLAYSSTSPDKALARYHALFPTPDERKD